jgi:nitrite reductase (NADH) large subunit
MQKIVVIGTGPIGRHFAETLHDLDKTAEILMVGNEPAYNRIHLVDMIEGISTADSLREPNRFRTIEASVKSIDRAGKKLVLEDDSTLLYDKLVLSTGASPVTISDAPKNVLPLRTMTDAQNIMSAAYRSKNVVIIGGGALGVETACAIKNRHPNMFVTLVHAAPQLLDRMLDSDGGEYMLDALTRTQINFRLEAKARSFLRSLDNRVTAVELDNGDLLPADLVVTAIGARPNDELARAVGLNCERGVCIDLFCRTSDNDIYAIGDCTQKSIGLLQPGYEQAEIAARNIAGFESVTVPTKSIICNRLKTRHKAFSVGVFSAEHEILYRNSHTFRKLFLDVENRLVGAVVFGAWDELPAIEYAVLHGQKISASRLALFRAFGVTTFKTQHPSDWSDDAVVCQCKRITKGQIMNAVCKSVEAVGQCTGAGTGCGGCKPLIAHLLDIKPEPVKFARPLAVFAGVATILAMLLAAFSIPYPDSFHSVFSLLYRSHFAKLVSGYSILALTAALAVLGIRKRKINRPYDTWKLVHVVLGILVLIVLALHSGGRVGTGLTMGLSVAFIGAALTGGLLALVFSRSHVLPALQTPLRKGLHWLHVIFLWPLPVLLAFHILQSYFWS